VFADKQKHQESCSCSRVKLGKWWRSLKAKNNPRDSGRVLALPQA